MPLKAPIAPMLPCDVCGSTENVKWWGETSATCCGSDACNAAHAERWHATYEDYEAADQHAREMGWVG